MSSRSYTAHYLEAPHAEPTPHIEAHAGTFSPPIWFELVPARLSMRPGTLYPPIRPQPDAAQIEAHPVAMMARTSVVAGRIQAISRVLPNYVEAAPFRPGYPRRVKIIGPLESDGSLTFPITGLADGDVIVYSTNSAGYSVSGMGLDGDYGVDWFYATYPTNAISGAIRVVNAANVSELSLFGTGSMIGVAAVYRDVDTVWYDHTTWIDPVTAGFAPEVAYYGSRDGQVLAVRAVTFFGEDGEVPTISWAEATLVVEGYDIGAPTYSYTGYAGIAEGRVAGPPAPEEQFIGVNPNPVNDTYQSMTVCLVENTLPPQAPDPENYATTGVSRIPAG